MRYLITSKPGMTPYHCTDSLAEATDASEEARSSGLDGEIWNTETDTPVEIADLDPEVEESVEPTYGSQEDLDQRGVAHHTPCIYCGCEEFHGWACARCGSI